MKIRIKDNSIRLRLTRSEVKQLSETGIVQSTTPFADAEFRYAVQSIEDLNGLQARITPYSIEMFVPSSFSRQWYKSDEVSCKALIPLANNKELKLLLEKDFVCLDDSEEDQTDNYDNPNAICNP